jgi:hypothetical protein
MLVLTISKDLDELLQDGGLAAIASLCKLRRIVIMAINFSIVFVIAVLGTKDSGTDGASEMLDMIFAVQRRDVRTPKRTPTLETEQIQTSKVIRLAEGILSATVLSVHRKEL